MSEEDEDLNLSLALGSANYRAQTKSSNSSGAGVNAKFKVDMAFAESDPLSELVWLPNKGLSLKAVNSRFADRRPFLRWNMGPSNEVLPPFQWDRPIQAGDEEVIDDVKLTLSLPRVEADNELVDKTGSAQIEDSSKQEGKLEELAGANRLTRFRQNNDEPNAKILSEDTNARFVMEHNDKGTSSSGGVNRNMDTEACFNHTPPTVNLEASEEIELRDLIENAVHSSSEMKLLIENSVPVERFSINNTICLYQQKGKEKAVSDGGIYKRSSSDDDDRNETVESCSSVGLFSRGTKRENYDHDLITESKRIKKQIQGSHGSTSEIKPRNSFIHWISNMVKGLSDSCKEETPALGLTLACCNEEQQKEDHKTIVYNNKTRDFPSVSMGFQTMFQSLYSRDNKVPFTEPREENSSLQEKEEIMVAGEALISYPAEPCQGNNENSCKKIVISNKQVNTHISTNPIDQRRHSCGTNLAENKVTEIPACDNTADITGPNFLLGTGDMPGKFNHLTSLWITRLTSRIHQLENCNQISQQTIESTQYPKVVIESHMNDIIPVDQRSLESKSHSSEGHVHPSAEEMQEVASNLMVSSMHKLKHEIPFPVFGSSEPIASVFAKRLDALKHITPSEKTSSSSFTCFFCGKSGHDLRECPEISETELENLLIQISSYDKMEESQCLCIRCLKDDHWAISCPSASLNKHGESKQNVSYINHFTAVDPPEKSSSKKTNFRSHSENEMMDNQTIFQLLRYVTVQDIHVPVEIFHAVRKLRLSRGDIQRCMNSHLSLAHLSGFFLRLRLGNMGLTLAETDYYVSCITGNASENIGSMSTRSISVDVGGFKSSVRSQYISNHDFLEDEIKAWWYRMLKSGSKLPSVDELNSKLKHRISLGF